MKGKPIISQSAKWCKIMSREVLERLKETRTTYKEMIDFCCDNLVMNNYIIRELSEKGFYFDIENGTDYDEEEDYYYDVYQYFIIGDRDAERLKEYTNELCILLRRFGPLYFRCNTFWHTLERSPGKLER